uniref:Uncharacterized protein n=1 Tax=Tetraselmis sp. GSL018 TaxID=582737 RepID=A0A061RZE3_9CHLO|eukprot:CAMPEP_0177607462 /NCGR_PEP_ID=MMETSP0419_2-20121207/17932_1 /TAXON_ID=582737 /ORGANISM="Tetraselmis sp., Strain GSL018" /LENGTH=283 /DNA_ID=CAMNT_0019102049 /DNA_START=986 /DNA_END=1837 /DNA_ORIENTATION=-
MVKHPDSDVDAVVPVTWENIYQLYLRRTHAAVLADSWLSLAETKLCTEISGGLAGAYVRVDRKSAGVNGEGYMICQVLRTSRPGKNDFRVRLKLEGIEPLVAVDTLSDTWPTWLEIASLKDRMCQGHAVVLVEGELVKTLARLSTIHYFSMLCSFREEDRVLFSPERVSRTHQMLLRYIRDERDVSAGIATHRPDRGGSEATAVAQDSCETGFLRRSKRSTSWSNKREFADMTKNPESQVDTLSVAEPSKKRTTPLKDRKPVIGEMKPRKFVKLKDLMISAEH